MNLDNLIKTEVFDENYPLPLVLSPRTESIDLLDWAEKNKNVLDELLVKHGGILFRGFDNISVDNFQEFIGRVAGQTLEYRERSSPRTRVSGNIYTSTEYPADKEISLHNENSYQKRFPSRIFFFCETPSETGGETPIADCRRVLNRLEKPLVESFSERKWMLIRNFNRGFGLKWQSVFQTEDRAEVETHCRENDISFAWEAPDILQTRVCRKAIHRHPQTDEPMWFNHGVFFHASSIEPGMRRALEEVFDDEQLPSNTFWGDGEIFSEETIETIRQAYKDETVKFEWKKNDLLMLDNMLVAHGRASFTGNRRILVGMSDLITS